MREREAERHIAVEALTYRYPRNQTATLAGIRMEVAQGEIAAIVGASGSGKSTLLHLLAGLARPSAGEVRVGGAAVAGPSPSRVLMFQDAALYPWMSVAENAGLGLRFAGAKRAAERARALEVLRLVQLEDFADVNVQQLSGGQQQRVALARALAPAPEVLLLDEPFSSLDRFTRMTLQRDVRAILRQLGMTAVIVTHDIDEAVAMADRVHVMTRAPGRIAGTVAAPARDPRDPADPVMRRAAQAVVRLFEHASGVPAEPADDNEAPVRAVLTA